MIFISHRGNIRRRDSKLENKPEYINSALALGFNVEVDVWMKNDCFYLGHDYPLYNVSIDFFRDPKIWAHAKNLDAMHELILYQDIHCFYHQRDACTLTSFNYIWVYPYKGAIYSDRAILVMPEKFGAGLFSFGKLAGICSDFIEVYKEKYDLLEE